MGPDNSTGHFDPNGGGGGRGSDLAPPPPPAIGAICRGGRGGFIGKGRGHLRLGPKYLSTHAPK